MNVSKYRTTALAGTVLAALLVPVQGWADDTDGCTTLANSAAAGLANTIAADDQTIKPPQSVTTLSCLGSFYNGTGLNVITNLLDPGSLLATIEGKICSAVQSTWNNYVGSVQCGLTITGCSAALTARCPAAQARHFGRGSSLVDEHQACRVEVRLRVEPGLPPEGHVRPVLFGGVCGFF